MGPSQRSPTTRSIALAVRGARGTVTTLPPFADDGEGAVAALESQVLDVGADGLGDPQPVERQHTDQGVIAAAGQSGGDQHGADLVAVQAGGVGLVVKARSPHVRRRGHGDQALLFGVPVEARHRAQPTSDRGPGPPEGLEVTGEPLDVGAACPEHRHPVFGAPSDVLAQIERVRVTGEAAVAGQEPRQRQLLVRAEQFVSGRDRGACRDGNVHDGTSKRHAEAPLAETGHTAPATIRGSRPYASPARSLQSGRYAQEADGGDDLPRRPDSGVAAGRNMSRGPLTLHDADESIRPGHVVGRRVSHAGCVGRRGSGDRAACRFDDHVHGHLRRGS
jgi:hypothetical protein